MPIFEHAVILSASRMTDLPAYYPQFMIDAIEKRIQHGQKVHTIVIWTKHAYSLNQEPLRSYLCKLMDLGIQLSIQLTITGMGGVFVGTTKQGCLWGPEPNVPLRQESVDQLVSLVHLVGDAARITVRIDPLAKFRFSDGSCYSNLAELSEIVALASKMGVKRFSFSLLEPRVYKKVVRRYDNLGVEIQAFTQSERVGMQAEIAALQGRFDCEIKACCVEGFPTSACISGDELMRIHKQGLSLSLKKAFTRPLCNCSHSIDIGGWPPKACYSGCDYCYARPVYSKK